MIDIFEESPGSFVLKSPSGRFLRLNESGMQMALALIDNPDIEVHDEQAIHLKDLLFTVADESKTHGSVKFKIYILSGEISQKLASPVRKIITKFPFITSAYYPFIVLIGAAVFALFSLHDSIEPAVRGGWFILAIVGMLLGALVHELGHVGALTYYGKKPRWIGIGLLYYVVPCFFADVSEAWLLSRAKRIFVSLSGSLCQIVYALLLLLACSCISETYKAAIQYSVKMNLLLALIQLIPFKNSDGYWVARDLIGNRTLVNRVLVFTSWLFFLAVTFLCYRSWANLLPDIWFSLNSGYFSERLYSLQVIYLFALTGMVLKSVVIFGVSPFLKSLKFDRSCSWRVRRS